MFPVPSKLRRKHWRWLALLVAILALAAAVRALFLYRPFEAPATAEPHRPGQSEPQTPDGEPLEPLPGGRQTFLVMGVEGWEGEYGRSDSMVLVSYDSNEQRLAMLSIPRDLWTHIPGHGYDKINHAFAFGGPTLSVETVERLLGIDIDHWVAISFEGFVEVIDALGGVEVNPPKPLYYVDPFDSRFGPNGLVIDIEAGPQVMDGLTALKYARFRADAEGDLGRMRRQQELIQAAVKKAASPAIFTKAPQLISALYSTIGTDMTVGEMLKLAGAGRQALTNPMTTATITADEYWIDGIFYFGADLVELRTMAYELLVGEPPTEAFLEKARADNEVYQSVLAEAYARSQAALAEEGDPDEEGDGEPGDREPGDREPGDADPGEGDRGEGDHGEGGKRGNPDGDDPGDREPAGSDPAGGDAGDRGAPTLATVNLVDATGQGVAWEYVDRLEALGLEVARVHESRVVMSSTLALVRVPDIEVSAELASLFPELNVQPTYLPDPTAPHDIDLVLGTDLLADR